jgi:DNA-binding NarL/FixJ family response regulator
MAYCLNNLGETAAGRGLDAEALVAFDQALGLFRQMGDLTGEGVALANLAAIALRSGDVPRAAASLAEVLGQQREAKTPAVVADALVSAAAVVSAVGHVRLAPELLAVAAGIRAASQSVPSPAVRRRSERATGAAKAALGRVAFDAATAAARTVTVDEAMAHATAVLSGLAPQQGDEGQAPPAVIARRAAVAAAPVTLTKRQREVLRLLVAGSTDPEIADELGIGVRTVESHVAAILDKLRVHARTAAVAYAVRHGLG